MFTVEPLVIPGGKRRAVTSSARLVFNMLQDFLTTSTEDVCIDDCASDRVDRMWQCQPRCHRPCGSHRICKDTENRFQHAKYFPYNQVLSTLFYLRRRSVPKSEAPSFRPQASSEQPSRRHKYHPCCHQQVQHSVSASFRVRLSSEMRRSCTADVDGAPIRIAQTLSV